MSGNPGYIGAWVVVSALMIIAVILLFVGLRKQRGGYLVMLLVVIGLVIALMFILVVLASMGLYTINNDTWSISGGISECSEQDNERRRVDRYPDYDRNRDLRYEHPNENRIDCRKARIMLGVGLATSLISLALNIWFFVVILGAFRFLRELERANRVKHVTVVKQQQPVTYAIPAKVAAEAGYRPVPPVDPDDRQRRASGSSHGAATSV